MITGENLKITCLQNLNVTCSEWAPDVIFSFIDPGTRIKEILAYKPAKHFIYELYDQEQSADLEHMTATLKKYMNDISTLETNAKTKIIFHCHAGVSRSTAFAYIYLHYHGSNAFSKLLRLANKPWPNYKICEIMENLYFYTGDLTADLLRYRQQHKKRLQAYRRLNLARGLISPVKR
nr:dual specificity protein phosphatase family protein [Pseudomonas putida]